VGSGKRQHGSDLIPNVEREGATAKRPGRPCTGTKAKLPCCGKCFPTSRSEPGVSVPTPKTKCSKTTPAPLVPCPAEPSSQASPWKRTGVVSTGNQGHLLTGNNGQRQQEQPRDHEDAHVPKIHRLFTSPNGVTQPYFRLLSFTTSQAGVDVLNTSSQALGHRCVFLLPSAATSHRQTSVPAPQHKPQQYTFLQWLPSPGIPRCKHWPKRPLGTPALFNGWDPSYGRDKGLLCRAVLLGFAKYHLYIYQIGLATGAC
jgi:hypothetical protein